MSGRRAVPEAAMSPTPRVLAVRPGTKVSKADRAALKEIGVVVVSIAPENVVEITGVSLLPGNDMLRCALQTLKEASGYSDADDLRADFANRVLHAYLELGRSESTGVTP
ncbi:MAG TPA: hypothetical protein VFZ98_11215 [Vicinamibacterales bacterium]